MDTAKDIINKIISKIASIFKYSETNKQLLVKFEESNPNNEPNFVKIISL